MNLVARVVATWLSSKEFQDAAGLPCTLATRATEAGPKNSDAAAGAEAIYARGRLSVNSSGPALSTGMQIQSWGCVAFLLYARSCRRNLYFLKAEYSDHGVARCVTLSSVDEPFIERALFHNAISAS